MALNFGLLDQGGPTNFFEGYSQGQEKMQANAMAQQRAAQAQQEFGMRQQEFAAGQADKQRVAKAAVVTQKTASARDALLRAPTAADARRIVEMQYADPDLGPIRGRFGSLAQALAEVPDEPTAFQQYKEQEAMGMETFLKQQGSNRAFTTAMGVAPTNAMAPASAPSNAMVAPAMSGELQNKLGQRERLAMLADQSPQVKATINRLDSDIARLVEEQKPEPGFTLSAGQTRFPRGYTGVATAPEAAPAAVKPPDKIAIMTALGYPLTPEGDAAYEAAKRAAPTVAAPPAAIAEMRALGIPETQAGFALYNELKTKTPVAAPQALTTEERNARVIALGAGPEGSDAFNAALREEISRMTAKPAAAVKAEPTTNEMTNARAIALGAGPEGSLAYNQSLQTQLLRLTTKAEPVTAPPAPSEQMKNADAFARLKGEPGTPAYNKEFAAQMARLTAKSGGGEGGGGAGGAAGTGTVEVVDPKNPTRTIVVTKARAVAEGLTPAKAIEGLTPQMRQKLEASYPQATSSLKSHQNKSTMFIRDLKALRDSPGLDEVTGFAAGRAPGLTDAGRAAVALYDKVVAKGGFQAMQDLRDASKTGGALGNQSNMEGKQLIASFAAIDRKQNAKDVRKAINDAIDDINSSNTRLQDAYDLTYEYKRGTTAPAAGGVDANNPLLRGN